MRKSLKKALSALLAVILLLSAVPIMASAVDTLASTGKCGDNVTWSFNSSTGTLTISGTGDMANYAAVESPFYDNNLIKSIVINNSVTSIGNRAFYRCTSLTKVTIPNSVTSIGSDAFFNCSSLINVTIPNGVTYIDDYTFWLCESLTSVIIPTSVTSIGEYAFADCNSLTKITIPDSVVRIGNNAFRECTSLTNITIPDSVKSIGDFALFGCESLTKITVDKNNEYYCNDEYGVLYNNNKTELIQYPIGNTRMTFNVPNSVTSICDLAFSQCKYLTSIIIPDGVKNIGCSTFLNCTNITKVTIPNSVTSIGEGVFDHCISLTSITIPNSITSIGYGAFFDCKSLISVTIPDSVTSIGGTAFDNCCSLTSITVSNSVTSIGDYAFLYCYSLSDVYFTGSKEQWSKVVVGEYNEPLLNANIHYLGTSSYTVSYNANGGSVSPTSATVESGKSVTLPTPTRSGYTCLGWSTSKTATSATYGCGSSYKPTANITLYAVWKQNVVKYTVSYNANGGSVSPTSATVESGKSVTLPTPTRSGYTCLGWSNSKTATSATYSCGSSYKPTANITLYAVWKQNPTTNIYNLGEETYSFKNFGNCDNESTCKSGYGKGHCYGMSVTSEAFYRNILAMTNIGEKSTQTVHGLNRTSALMDTVCYYQNRQSSSTIVAGGRSYYQGKDSNSAADWNEVVNYVDNHSYDNKGNLVISIRRGNSGHAVDFLYYKEVNGQQRIYIYDNNFPDVEIYLYKGSDGLIYETPKSTYNGGASCIALRSLDKCIKYAGDYDGSRVIYAEYGTIEVDGATITPMDCGPDDAYVMYEIPQDYSEVYITPLVDNAEFEYLDESYSFGNVNDDTIGVLTLANADDNGVTEEPNFTITVKPSSIKSIKISDVEMKYKSSAKITPKITTDGDVKYTVKYESSNPSVATVDKDGKITTFGKGETKITCTVTDSYGNTVKDTCTVTIKFSFGQWLIWILLFGFLWY